jgi:hypothetical protein
MRGINSFSPRFSRRSLLRGMGAGSLLMSGISRSLYAADVRTPRAVFLFYANGAHPFWAPKEPAGTNFTLTPHLAPMEAIKNDIVIFRNMVLERGSGNSHKSTSFSALGAGSSTSFDQTLADFVKGGTKLPSLEIAIGKTGGGGGAIAGLSQRGGNFLPGATNPVAAYQRVAQYVTTGATPPSTSAPPMTTPGSAEQALLARRSLLDYIRDDVNTFKGRLGGMEKSKMDFYLESLRTLETSIGGNIGGGEIKPTASCNKGTPPPAMLSADVHVNDMPVANKLFSDIIAIALACGVVRVASAMWGGGQSDEPIKINDITMGDWHSVSHGDPNGGAGLQMQKLMAYMASEYVYLVQKLKSYVDGAGSLLDNTAVVLSTQNGCSTQVGNVPSSSASPFVTIPKMDHPKFNTPMIVAGSCGGFWKTGKMIDCNNRAHNDVYLTIAQAFGMKVTTVGDPNWCKGPMPGFAG